MEAFTGGIYIGSNFLVGNFLGGNFLGDSLLGGQFSWWNTKHEMHWNKSTWFCFFTILLLLFSDGIYLWFQCIADCFWRVYCNLKTIYLFKKKTFFSPSVSFAPTSHFRLALCKHVILLNSKTAPLAMSKF